MDVTSNKDTLRKRVACQPVHRLDSWQPDGLAFDDQARMHQTPRGIGPAGPVHAGKERRP